MVTRALLILLTLAVCSAQAAAEEPAPLTLADVLSAQQIASIAARRNAGPPPPGDSFAFTFRDVPGYGNVDVHYLIETVGDGNRATLRLAEQPSAVVYVLQAKRYSEIRRHLSDAEFADVLEQMLAIEKAGDTVRGVKIRRALFDVGAAPAVDFLKGRRDYYDSARGTPLFEAWPAEFRKPAGKLAVSVVHTEIWRSNEKTPESKTLYAKQFFGYLFPVLDEILTPEQKAQLADGLRQTNVRTGPASIPIENVKDFGPVTVTYLIREDKPLAHPTAMTTRVTLGARDIAADPMLARKHLAPEGADYLLAQVRAGEKAGQKLQSVEIVRLMIDIVAKGTPAGDAAHAEFKRNLATYCRQDFLIRPETWPDKFLHPDGKFDVELTTTSISWKVLRKE